MRKADWGGDPVCWWLGLYFCFVCCLDEVSCTGWLCEARVLYSSGFLCVSSHYFWYSLGLVFWQSRVLESVLPLQRLRAWSWVLCGSIYSFPLVRYSRPLSAGVLHALLCLKEYSWCIPGERCTPHPPTPLPSCSLASKFFTTEPPGKPKINYYFFFLIVGWVGSLLLCKGFL